MDFFESTGGPRWTRNDGWGTIVPPCSWYGVFCDHRDEHSVVSALWLDDNNLRGSLPASLADLEHLKDLSVARNHLSGVVPRQLLTRWDEHLLDFDGDGNAFSELVIHASVEYEATGTLCAEHEDVRYRAEFDGTRGRAVFQSVRCRPGSRETFCLVREGSPYSLWRFSRALDALRYRQFGGTYSYLSGFTTHQVTLTTTAEWRDGTRRTVESYGRQGPLAVWTAQQLFLTLMNETRWEREFRRATCDMMQ